MNRLDGCSLAEQTPRRQLEVLQSIEKDDDVTVVLEEKGGLSGPVTSVVENGPSDDLEEVHVQFLNYESDYRHDDHPHHTVSITRTEDGDWDRAELTYSWTDTGRVRQETVDDVERIWHSFSTLRNATELSWDEAAVVSMRESGLSKAEIAEQWGCDERTITALFADVRNRYRRAQRTVDELESASIDLDGRRFPTIGTDSDSSSGQPDWTETSDLEEESESE